MYNIQPTHTLRTSCVQHVYHVLFHKSSTDKRTAENPVGQDEYRPLLVVNMGHKKNGHVFSTIRTLYSTDQNAAYNKHLSPRSHSPQKRGQNDPEQPFSSLACARRNVYNDPPPSRVPAALTPPSAAPSAEGDCPISHKLSSIVNSCSGLPFLFVT